MFREKATAPAPASVTRREQVEEDVAQVDRTERRASAGDGAPPRCDRQVADEPDHQGRHHEPDVDLAEACAPLRPAACRRCSRRTPAAAQVPPARPRPVPRRPLLRERRADRCLGALGRARRRRGACRRLGRGGRLRGRVARSRRGLRGDRWAAFAAGPLAPAAGSGFFAAAARAAGTRAGRVPAAAPRTWLGRASRAAPAGSRSAPLTDLVDRERVLRVGPAEGQVADRRAASPRTRACAGWSRSGRARRTGRRTCTSPRRCRTAMTTRCLGFAGSFSSVDLDAGDGAGALAGLAAGADGGVDLEEAAVARRQHVAHRQLGAVRVLRS